MARYRSPSYIFFSTCSENGNYVRSNMSLLLQASTEHLLCCTEIWWMRCSAILEVCPCAEGQVGEPGSANPTSYQRRRSLRGRYADLRFWRMLRMQLGAMKRKARADCKKWCRTSCIVTYKQWGFCLIMFFENVLILKISEFNGDDGKGKTGEEKAKNKEDNFQKPHTNTIGEV